MGRNGKLAIYHVTAPTCWWSWGYEATLNRIRLLYGDQVDLHLYTGCVYENFEGWLKGMGMIWDDYLRWQEESAKIMGVPLGVIPRPEQMPRNVMPVSYAAMAAKRQGPERGERFFRALLRLFNVEAKDVTKEPYLLEAAEEAGLDLPLFKTDYADTRARRGDLDEEKRGMPHLPLGFYNIAITDKRGRTVLIDHAFEPRVVEQAIDYLTDGGLAKEEPEDIVAYLRDHGLSPLVEISRVMGLTLLEATARLGELEEQGAVERHSFAGAPHWKAVRRS